ncbi:hypothetical protein R1sor_000631 [Riccia sorocarpa]|uniref:Uncharacterized protein n=1 Tax=Riccia sorocarpa TaxID=122646 RepID=A0ABD3GZN4_9MARC
MDTATSSSTSSSTSKEWFSFDPGDREPHFPNSVSLPIRSHEIPLSLTVRAISAGRNRMRSQLDQRNFLSMVIMIGTGV